MTIRHLICKKCEDFVFSFNRHDMQWCKCGSCALDGGFDYQKITGNREDRILVSSEMSVAIDSIREKFEWTQRYDKNSKPLDKYVTKKLKKLSTDHILGILSYFTNSLYEKLDGEPERSIDKSWFVIHEIFIQELLYRKKHKLK